MKICTAHGECGTYREVYWFDEEYFDEGLKWQELVHYAADEVRYSFGESTVIAVDFELHRSDVRYAMVTYTTRDGCYPDVVCKVRVVPCLLGDNLEQSRQETMRLGREFFGEVTDLRVVYLPDGFYPGVLVDPDGRFYAGEHLAAEVVTPGEVNTEEESALPTIFIESITAESYPEMLEVAKGHARKWFGPDATFTISYGLVEDLSFSEICFNRVQVSVIKRGEQEPHVPTLPLPEVAGSNLAEIWESAMSRGRN